MLESRRRLTSSCYTAGRIQRVENEILQNDGHILKRSKVLVNIFSYFNWITELICFPKTPVIWCCELNDNNVQLV
jgi:hypothetical protein